MVQMFCQFCPFEFCECSTTSQFIPNFEEPAKVLKKQKCRAGKRAWQQSWLECCLAAIPIACLRCAQFQLIVLPFLISPFLIKYIVQKKLSKPLWSLFPFKMSIFYNYPIRTYQIRFMQVLIIPLNHSYMQISKFIIKTVSLRFLNE